MDKFYLNVSASAPESGFIESEFKERELNDNEFSARRIFNGMERRFLSMEARSMAYGLFDSKSVPPGVTENAVQQAVALGALSGEEIDAQTFEALFHAVALNPSFKIPAWFISSSVSSDTRIC